MPTNPNRDHDWQGGLYELAIEVGPRSGYALTQTLDILAREDCPIALESIDVESAQVAGGVRGATKTPSGKAVRYQVTCIREEEGSDWLSVGFPMASLEQHYPVGGFPFGDDWMMRPWQAELDEWLVDVAEFVFSLSPFLLGLIGFDVAGAAHSASYRIGGIPSVRHFSILWPDAGRLTVHKRNA